MIIAALFILLGLCGCKESGQLEQENQSGKLEKRKEQVSAKEKQEKDYNIVIEEKEKSIFQTECYRLEQSYIDIYKAVRKKDDQDSMLSKENIKKIYHRIAGQGYSVTSESMNFNMKNYKQVETFVEKVEAGAEAKVSIYKLNTDGGFERMDFEYDGDVMTLTSGVAGWSQDIKPTAIEPVRCKIKKWKYTKKGWLIYEQCVPEPPEVTEVMNGNAMVRIKPLKEEYREICERLIIPVGYQGNNLFLTDWDKESLEKIDFNDLYEYIFKVENKNGLVEENVPNGIPKEEFEELFTKYFPITSTQLEKMSVYQSKDKKYQWVRLGCGNYAPDMWGIPIPEVVDIKENEDGTTVLWIDAVWEGKGLDCAFSHKVTLNIKKGQDTSIQYLGNYILDSEDAILPQYNHRIKK